MEVDIKHDKKASAVYITTSRNRNVKKTESITDDVMADFSEENELVGIEILGVEKFSASSE